MEIFVIVLTLVLFYHLSKGFKEFAKRDKGASFNGSQLFEQAKYIISLVAKVAKSDGRVDESEAYFIGDVLDDLVRQMGGGALERQRLKEIYDKEKSDSFGAFKLAFSYKHKFGISTQECISKLYFFLNLAYIDGKFDIKERDIYFEICDGFEIPKSLQERILAQFESEFRAKNSHNSGFDDRQKDPFKTLGVAQNTDFESCKKAYRELVRRYHPDILMGRGESEEVVSEATKKLQLINEAYDEIKRIYGK